MKRAYIYARVSTAEQNKGDITSIENQIETCKHFIAIKQAEGWQHVKTITDPGFSGKDLDRPGIKELMAEVAQGNVDVVVTYKVDRVSRSLIKFYEFNKLLEGHKVEFASATQSFDTSSSSGRLMLNILLSFAEYERELISERTADKMQANFERGKWGGGYVPYGYELDPVIKDLKVHPKESKAVRLMFESIAAGMTLARTAEFLHEKGHVTKSRIVKRQNGKEVNIGGRKFREDIVFRMIRNPFYCGFMTHNGKLGKHRYETIIPKTLYDKANSSMKKKSPDNNGVKIKPNADRHVHLLKGILKCDDCGCSMTPVPSGKKDKDGNQYLYYVCTEVNHYKDAKTCKVRSLPARHIEDTMIHYLKDLGEEPGILNTVIAASNKHSDAEVKKLKKEEDRLSKEILEVSQGIGKFIQVIKASKKVSPEMQAEVDVLSAQREKFSGELEKVRVDLSIHASKQLEMETIRKSLLRFTEVIGKLPLEDKKELVSLILREVKVSRVNHEKGKAPAEAGAFNCPIRTSWFRVVVTINAIPSLPVVYDDQAKKFVFTSKWLPGEDSNLRHGD